MNEKELEQAELENSTGGAADAAYACMEVAGIESMTDCEPSGAGHFANS